MGLESAKTFYYIIFVKNIYFVTYYQNIISLCIAFWWPGHDEYLSILAEINGTAERCSCQISKDKLSRLTVIWICDEGDGNAIQTSVHIFPSILSHYRFDRPKLLYGDLKQTNIPT